MTLDEFAAKVRWMRACQKDYFRGRTDAALKAAKEAEAKVDAALKALARGPDLFGAAPEGPPP